MSARRLTPAEVAMLDPKRLRAAEQRLRAHREETEARRVQERWTSYGEGYRDARRTAAHYAQLLYALLAAAKRDVPAEYRRLAAASLRFGRVASGEPAFGSAALRARGGL